MPSIERGGELSRDGAHMRRRDGEVDERRLAQLFKATAERDPFDIDRLAPRPHAHLTSIIERGLRDGAPKPACADDADLLHRAPPAAWISSAARFVSSVAKNSAKGTRRF